MPEAKKRRRTSRGICTICNDEIGKAQMTAHLEKHLVEQVAGPGVRIKRFHLLVAGADSPEYWLHLDIRVDTTLNKLDSYLRAIWLECCGHMSQFTIGGMTLGKSRKIGQSVGPGATFSHEYDFGSTTELNLRVLAEHDGDPGPEAILLLARNTPPPILCEECGLPAAWMGCDDDGEYHEFCDECAGEDDEGFMLPVVNSPRTGVCGYTG